MEQEQEPKRKHKTYAERFSDKSKIKATKKLSFLVSVPTFAERKNIAQSTVKYHILRGYIEVVLIGELEDRYIDWRKYKEYQFNKE